jgi:hypothetical protein
MLAFASDTDLDGIPQITNVISPTSYYDSIRSFRSGELVKCDQVNGIIFNRPDAPPEAINSYYSGTYRYPDAAGTTMGGELAVPHMAALASGNSGIIEYADTSNTTVAVDNYTTLSGLAYTATYGLEFSPDGKMLAFFHNRMSFGGGSSIMSLLYV